MAEAIILFSIGLAKAYAHLIQLPPAEAGGNWLEAIGWRQLDLHH